MQCWVKDPTYLKKSLVDLFQSSLSFKAKLSGKHRDFLYTLLPPHTQLSPTINVLHQGGTFVANDEPTWTYCYPPEFIVNIRVCSWCFTFYGFGQIYNDIYPLSQYHTEQFHCLKSPLCSTYSSLFLHPTPGNHQSFYCLHSVAFSRMS